MNCRFGRPGSAGVKVVPKTRGPNGYVLKLDGDVTVSDPVDF